MINVVKRVGDLHLHSIYSDGSLTLKELLGESKGEGLSFISITDHDTLNHLFHIETSVLNNDSNIEIIPGIELTTTWKDVESHILGYYIDWENPILINFIDKVSRTREKRMKLMVEKLCAIGIDIDFETIKSKAKGGYLARNHIAEVLLERGYIKTIKEAFNPTFLGKGGKIWVERVEACPEDVMKVIRISGGVSVLAHPGNTPGSLERITMNTIKLLKDWGLQGIEAFQPKHGSQDTKHYVKIARDLDLILTGGSDYHGKYSPDISLGEVKLPYIFLNILKSYL